MARTGTHVPSDGPNRAAHVARADVASTSKPSTPARVAICCTINDGSTVLRVEKFTSKEDDRGWRDMMALSESCAGDHAQRRAGRLIPESSTACLVAQTSIGLPAHAESGRGEFDLSVKLP